MGFRVYGSRFVGFRDIVLAGFAFGVYRVLRFLFVKVSQVCLKFFWASSWRV